MRKLTLILITLLLAVNFITSEEVNQKPVVAIYPFDAKNIEQSEVDTLLRVFTTELVGTGKFRVTDRSDYIMDKIKKEHSFQIQNESDSIKLQLGKNLNADMIVFGQIISFGGKFIADFRIVDINTMDIVSSTKVHVGSILELFEKVPEIVKTLAGKTEETSTLSTSDNKTKNKKTYYVGDKGPGGDSTCHTEF